MKKFTFLVTLLVLMGSAFAQKSWVAFTSDQPGQPQIRLEQSNRAGAVYSIDIPGMYSENVTAEKQSFQRISLLEDKTTQDVGRPELPMLHQVVGIPGNQKATYTVTDMETMKLSGYHIYPFQTPTTDNPGGFDHEFVIDKAFYQKDAAYPAENVLMSKPGIWRDVKVAGLHITPFTYNPATGDLTVITHLTVKVEFGGVDESMTFNPRMELTPKFYNMYKVGISNFEDLGYTETLREEPGIKYLVITNEEAVDAIQPLVDWKNQMGMKVEVRTLEPGFEDPQDFKDYITQLYENDGLEYVLIVGDAYPNGGTGGGPNIVPMFYWAPGGEDPSYSDSWYTCLDGPDDHYADLAIGRFVYDANSLDQLEVQIQKTMTHYTAPDNSDWAENTILLAHKQEYPGKYTQCCEEIATYNYSVQTPAFEKAYGGEGYSNAEVVSFVNNNGVGIFNYRGHGSQTQLWDWTSANPTHFTATDVAQLNNTNQLFVFFDVCCDNMDIVGYNGECLCESFMKHPTASVAVNGAIIPSYTVPNHDYDKEMYKAVFDENITNIGYVTNFANLTVLNDHGDLGRSNVRTYLWLGDASLEPWTKQPMNFTVTHDAQIFLGVSEFTVNVLGEEGPAENALVCVSNEDGSVYAVAYTDETGTAMVTFDSPVQTPGDANITVTLHNYMPYQQTVPVIPQDGPYVVKDSFVINDNSGNGNGLMDYAESILLSLSVKNVGIQTAQNVVVSLSTDDEYVTITDGEETYGNIDPDAVVTVDDGFAFDVADDIPDGHAVLFEVSATDGTDSWTSNVIITGHAPVLELGEFTISDPTGNNNGKLDPGEDATITVQVLNSGSADAYTVMGDLTTGDSFLEVTTSDPQTYGDITAAGQGTATFEVHADEATPAGHMAQMDFDMSGEHNINAAGMFTVVIGQIPVVIIDLDPNNSSGPAMQQAMEDLGVSVEYGTTIPDDMNLYSSAFVCLGIYSSNHVLSTAEGQKLADFLDNGGRLYMEGGDTWYYDDQTAVHSMFNITSSADGSSDLATLNGQAGTFAEGMSFSYGGENNYIDHLAATGDAELIFQNSSPVYGCAVSYDAGNYKTVGTSFEFGGLDDSDATKDELMEQYLMFFDIISSGVNANFQADVTEVCTTGEIQYTDNSTGGVTEWSWEFPGGTPATSTEQNPTVTYNAAGNFDVTLTVTGTSGTNSTTKSNYITVMDTPETAAEPTGENQLCENAQSTMYSTTGATYATEYNWMISPAEAGTISGSGLTAMVDWNDAWSGEAQITVAGVNDCGEGEASNPMMVTIDPMPEAAGDITGNGTTCQGYEEIYNIASIANADDYNWTIDPSTAGTMVINGNQATITWSDSYEGTATLKVCGTNDCGEGAWSTDFDVLVENCTGIGENTGNSTLSIFPNPNNGQFTLEISANDRVDVQIINTVGKVVYEINQLKVEGSVSRTINLNDFANGIYYLKLKGSTVNTIEKIILSR